MDLTGHGPGGFGDRFFHADESHFEQLLDLLLGVETHGGLFGAVHDIVDPLPDVALDRANQSFRRHVDLHGSPLSDDARSPRLRGRSGRTRVPFLHRSPGQAGCHALGPCYHATHKCPLFIGLQLLLDSTRPFKAVGGNEIRVATFHLVGKTGGMAVENSLPRNGIESLMREGPGRLEREARVAGRRRAHRQRVKERDGFALPVSLLVLIGLLLLFTAGVHSARLELQSARSLASSIRAFQAAEAGLALLETGATPGIDSTSIRDVRLKLRTDTLRTAGDGSLLLWHRAEAGTPDGTGGMTARRSLSRLWFVRPDGTRGVVAGGWRESIRLHPP